MRSSRKWVFGTTRGLTAPLVCLIFILSLCLASPQPANADTPAAGPEINKPDSPNCTDADQTFLDLNLPKLNAAHAVAAEGQSAAQLQAAVLRFELLLNQLEGHLQSKRPTCEPLRQYAFEVYSAYAFGLALTGEPELAAPLVQQLVNQDIPAVVPLSEQNKARLARFVQRNGLLVLLPQTYKDLLANLSTEPSSTEAGTQAMVSPFGLNGGQPSAGQPYSGEATNGSKTSAFQDPEGDWFGSVLLRVGRESNVSFAPSRSTLNLFTDFGLIEVDLGENFRQRSGWVGLVDGQLGRRYGLPSGMDLELAASMRVRQTSVESGDTESLSFSSSLYGLSGGLSNGLSHCFIGPSAKDSSPEGLRTRDRLTLTYELKTLFQQSVNSTELSYEYPVELQFARLEPLISYRRVDYDFSSSNARQMRLGLAMIPLQVSSWSVGDWGQIDYRPGVRLEWINDRAASPDRLGGEQFEGGVGLFIQAKWGKWYGEASANSGRRASESVYSNFLLPDARLLVERSSIGLVAKKLLNSTDSFVLSFQQDWQRSSIELFQSDNQGLYLGFERRF